MADASVRVLVALPVIEARGLTRRFGKNDEITAVNGLDLSVAPGEIFGLLGPNGAGKTTTLRMLVTLLKPSDGQATINGVDVAADPARVRRMVGIVYQDPSLDSMLTARENLELHGRLYGVPPSRLKARVNEMLALVNLEARADSPVKTFSGGMKRRLEIARGLLHEPAVVFLDEPTTGLDPQSREHIWDYIRRLRDEQGTTVVITTHYMDEADKLCDRIVIVDHGEIVAQGTPRELKRALGGDVVTITLGPDGNAAALRALDFVEHFEENPKTGELRLTVRDASTHLADIVTAAGAVAGLEVHPPTLEDVFIHHTGRGLRDTEENSSEAEAMMRVATQGGGS